MLELEVKDCREKGILVKFVQKYGSETINMLYTQFNLEDAKEVCGKSDAYLSKYIFLVRKFKGSNVHLAHDFASYLISFMKISGMPCLISEFLCSSVNGLLWYLPSGLYFPFLISA